MNYKVIICQKVHGSAKFNTSPDTLILVNKQIMSYLTDIFLVAYHWMILTNLLPVRQIRLKTTPNNSHKKKNLLEMNSLTVVEHAQGKTSAIAALAKTI